MMTTEPSLRLLLLPLLLLTLIAGCGGPDPTEQALSASEKAIALNYESLASEANSLHQAARSLCRKTSAPQVEAARQAWTKVMDQWQQAQAVRFGPVRDDDRLFRIQFWPDPRDLVATHIKELLKYDPAAPLPDISEASIRERSVAIQGLPAVEYLLYGEGDAAGVNALRFAADPQRCELLQAVTAHLATVTGELYQDWLKHPGRLTQYGVEEGHFANRQAAISALLNSSIEMGESVAGSKLGWPLGQRADGRLQPMRVESRRSGHSLNGIASNIAGMQRLLTAGGEGGLLAVAQHRGAGEKTVARVRALLEESQTQARAIETPLFQGLTAKENIEGYRSLLAKVEELNSLLSNEIAGALGVQVGFNFNDGD